MLRDALKALLYSSRRDVAVVGEAGTLAEAVAVLDRTHPDLAVIDLSLPDGDAAAFCRLLVRDRACKVLALSGHEGAHVAREARDCGVEGIALKSRPADEFLRAVDTIANGHLYSCEAVEQALTAAQERELSGPLRVLTSRERDVFRLVLRGLSNEAISRELNISRKTVETHRASVNHKLEAHSPADLVRFAARHGLLPELPARQALPQGPPAGAARASRGAPAS